GLSAEAGIGRPGQRECVLRIRSGCPSGPVGFRPDRAVHVAYSAAIRNDVRTSAGTGGERAKDGGGQHSATYRHVRRARSTNELSRVTSVAIAGWLGSP